MVTSNMGGMVDWGGCAPSMECLHLPLRAVFFSVRLFRQLPNQPSQRHYMCRPICICALPYLSPCKRHHTYLRSKYSPMHPHCVLLNTFSDFVYSLVSLHPYIPSCTTCRRDWRGRRVHTCPRPSAEQRSGLARERYPKLG